jgi:thermostable 8-oxoguanine DNA glycosylase
MKNVMKLVPIILLPIMLYSTEVPYSSVTLSYFVKDKVYTYEEKMPKLNILEMEEDNSAVTIVKSSTKRYVQDKLEVEFTVLVTLNRDIDDLVISDNIIEGFSYKKASLRLNNDSPNDFKLLDRDLTINIGDVKQGFSYKMSYIAEPIS